MKMKHFKFKLSVLFFALLAGCMVFQTQLTQAYPGGRSPEVGYFTGQRTGDSSWGDVFDGGIPNSTSKATFISFILNKLTGGNSKEQISAGFIISLQLGIPGPSSSRNFTQAQLNDWQDRINQPAITLQMRNYAFSVNSAFANDIQDDIFYDENGSRNSLIFNYNGVPVSVIKQDCGNPLDGAQGLPPAPIPTASLQGIVQDESQNPIGGGTVSVAGNSSNTNPFFFTGNIPAGPQRVNFTPPAGYQVIGYKFCAGASCNVDALGVFPDGNGFFDANFNGGETYNVRWIVRQIAVSSCGTPLTDPSPIESNTDYRIRVSVTVSPAAGAAAVAASGKFYITVYDPSGAVKYSNNNLPITNNGGGVLTSEWRPGATNANGKFSIVFGITGPSGPVTCGTAIAPAGTFTVAMHPYFSVLGGDISAGAGFGDCTGGDPTAGIQAFNTGATGGFKGAGTELAAYASAQITGFSSGTNASTGASTAIGTVGQPGGLAFSNTDPTNLGQFGSMGCVPDYAQAAVAGAVSPTIDDTATSVDVATLESGVYVYNNDGPTPPAIFTINGGVIGTNPDGTGKKITIVINSSAVLAGNITYSYGSGPNPIRNAPNLTIIVSNGTLHIASTVSTLTGFFVSQPSGSTGGAISTCSVQSAGVWTESIDPAVCSGQLTINGAVSAGSIHFNRTSGSLSSTPAETIQFSPELWAAGLLNCGGNVAQCAQADDYIVSLPPIL